MNEKYYRSYEDRYRMVYSQGVKYWTNLPWEVAEDLAGLEEFLAFTGVVPGEHSVLECGCGEGHLAVALAQRGFKYVGVELAPSAIAKARQRISEAGLEGHAEIIQADVTDLSFLPPASLDLALDNRLLHVLVVDQDRANYLATLRRVLKPGAYVMFNEIYREDAYSGPVASFEQFVLEIKPDLTTVRERAAYNGEAEVTVRIPQIPARPKNEAGYTSEIEGAGFKMVRFEVSKSHFTCRFYAQVR